ncbi:hypothetical protein JW935_13390, partial [candidate division KSB1 bacterium]|nr:hypothetical protein [candidate division KSB1 bacterium]
FECFLARWSALDFVGMEKQACLARPIQQSRSQIIQNSCGARSPGRSTKHGAGSSAIVSCTVADVTPPAG